MKDNDTDAAKRAITDGVITLGAPLRADVNGDRTFLVIPSSTAQERCHAV